MENTNLDIYGQQIADIKAGLTNISWEWYMGKGLFKIVKGNVCYEPKQGCLTQIRNNPGEAFAFIKGKINFTLTTEIYNGVRIPKHVDEITLDDLPIFAEWQRRIDKLQNN